MGILERIEAKLDQLLAAQASGQSVDLTAIAGTAPAAASAPAPTTSGELDAAGFPWDERIHSSSKEKVVAGTWKYKRGVEQHVKDAVENEFRAAGYGNQSGAVSGTTVPADTATQPVVTPEPTAQQTPAPTASITGAAGSGVNLPGLSLPTAPAPEAKPEPVKVQMPVWVEGAELDDSQITNVAAAAYAKLGGDAFAKLQALFKMSAGQPITDLPAEYRDSFHRVAADDSLLAHYQIV